MFYTGATRGSTRFITFFLFISVLFVNDSIQYAPLGAPHLSRFTRMPRGRQLLSLLFFAFFTALYSSLSGLFAPAWSPCFEPSLTVANLRRQSLWPTALHFFTLGGSPLSSPPLYQQARLRPLLPDQASAASKSVACPHRNRLAVPQPGPHFRVCLRDYGSRSSLPASSVLPRSGGKLRKSPSLLHLWSNPRPAGQGQRPRLSSPSRKARTRAP